MKYSNINEAISDNSRKKCKIKHCHRNRSRISGYCELHTQKNQQHGHPLHQKIIPKDYAEEKELCRSIIESNINHPGIQAALQWYEHTVFNLAGARVGFGLGEYNKLKNAGVTPMDMLLECVALAVFYLRQPNRIHDNRHFMYCLGNRFLRLVPRKGRIPGKTQRLHGERIWKNVKHILLNICTRILSEERDIENRTNMMKQPFEN